MFSKKIELNASTKLILALVVFALLFGISTRCFLKAFVYNSGEVITYNEKSEATYFVKLKENDYYETNRLPQGMSYIAGLIDEIELTYDYKFSVSELAKYDMYYTIDAIVKVYSDDKKTVLYEKKEPLLDAVTVYKDKVADYSFSQDISIDYDKYNEFAKEFKSRYGLTSDSDVSVVLNVVSKSTNDKFKKPITLDSKSLVRIPLTERTINISFEDDNISNRGTVVKKKLFSKSFIISFLLFIISFTGSIFVGIYIVKNGLSLFKGKSKYELVLSRILKENDSIIANVKDTADITNHQVIDISSFEELRDVHDNIGSPILYSEIDPGKTALFYIINEDILYRYLLNSADLIEKTIETNGGVNEEKKDIL